MNDLNKVKKMALVDQVLNREKSMYWNGDKAQIEGDLKIHDV